MLRITPEVRDHMFAHALSERPNEACGMFSWPSGSELVDRFHPMSNAAASPSIYRLDGQEMLDVEKMLDETGRDVAGVMHSHTVTSPYPSPTDVQDSERFDPSGTLRHIIVSLRDGRPVLRCFHISGNEIVELPVLVDDGTSDTGDDTESVAMAAVTPLRTPQR